MNHKYNMSDVLNLWVVNIIKTSSFIIEILFINMS